MQLMAAAPAQGSNRGDGGWCRQATVTLAQCSGDAGPAGARAAMVSVAQEGRAKPGLTGTAALVGMI